MSFADLTEKDLLADEKKVFGRIIDMWSLGTPEDPYSSSTESKVLKYAEKDGLSEEKILGVLKSLEDKGLIHSEREGKKTIIKYRVEAHHIVKELQKTTYVDSRYKFTPPHHSAPGSK
jgi:DNA-binding transcriptional ArsR family regulator